MATTKIWDVSAHVSKLLAYVANKSKTTMEVQNGFDDEEMRIAAEALGLSADHFATEEKKFVTGINCTPENANEVIDKAKAMCEQFPESIYDTVSELYEQMYCRCDEKKYIEYIKKNLRFTTEHLINKIRNFGTFAVQSAEEKICAYKKTLALIDLIYDDDICGFACYHVGHINCLLAKLYYTLNDTQNAVMHLEKGLHFSKVYDELPQEVAHTSFLLKGDTEDLSEVENGTQMNRVAYEISEFNKVLGENDSEKAYEDILNKYAPYAKNI